MKHITKALLLLSACTLFSVTLTAESDRDARSTFQAGEGSYGEAVPRSARPRAAAPSSGKPTTPAATQNSSTAKPAATGNSSAEKSVASTSAAWDKEDFSCYLDLSNTSKLPGSKPTAEDIVKYCNSYADEYFLNENKETWAKNAITDLNRALKSGKGVLYYYSFGVSSKYMFGNTPEQKTARKTFAPALMKVMKKAYELGQEIKAGKWGQENKAALMSDSNETGILRLLYYGYERFNNSDTKEYSAQCKGWFDLLKQ